MSIQIDEGDAVTVSLEPLVQAFENVFSHIPGIEQLLGPLGPRAANAPPTAASPQGVPPGTNIAEEMHAFITYIAKS